MSAPSRWFQLESGHPPFKISGHPYQELKSEGHLLPDAAFLAKPFGRHEINAKVAEVLRA